MNPNANPNLAIESIRPGEYRVMGRLSAEAYRQLESSCPRPAVSQDSSPQQVGFLLGVQFVLERLRNGFVVP